MKLLPVSGILRTMDFTDSATSMSDAHLFHG